MTFWDSAAKSIKMAQGFIRDYQGRAIPGIVFGAGDGQGNSRGYITKGTDGLDIFYITSGGNVARVRLADDGKLYLNDTEINAFSPDSPIPSQYIQQASYWNQALAGMVYDGVNYLVPGSKLTPAVNTAINQGAAAYGNFTNPANGYVDASGAILKAKIAAASEWDSKVDGTYPKFTNITPAGIYTGTLSASQIISGTIAAERIAILPDANIASASAWVKSSDGRFTYISPTGVYTGTLTADQVNTVTVNAAKLAMWGSPNNYGSIGGSYGDLVLYYNNSEYFRVYNDLTDVSFQYKGTEFMYSSGTHTYPKGAWNFTYASVGNLFSKASIGYSTPSVSASQGYHNHGITPGTKLAVVDDQLNIVGCVGFAQSSPSITVSGGSHTHSIS